ncbi:MAG: ribonuclease HII [Parvibaculum sp.]|uniref:ribonuclease HII n=1 Tax=Parvibaculum sp. TaxID=2024848 RepID=UPI00283D10CB|nr:ribonuclease HII [Parvibaculum sp.]MDR3497947.1 ribonuclease HII [Parvibaculum sp.]
MPKKSAKQGPDYSFETEHGAPRLHVCGVDEAGRGPLAGPVVAAAVVLDPADCPEGLDDSKKLDEGKRETLYAALIGRAQIGVGMASVEEIDKINILQATMLAMRRAVEALDLPPAFALIDGNRLPALACPARAIVKGDGRVLSIAAASIVAKVTRDRIMTELARAHPGFGWERNRGYGTAEHLNALKRLGATPHHRRSFAPIRNILSPDESGRLDLVGQNPLSL